MHPGATSSIDWVVLPAELYVRNFGPISRGHVVFSDFTIICGRQNTGKTYLALLTFALVETLARTSSQIDFSILDFVRETLGEGVYRGDFIVETVTKGLSRVREIIHSTLP